MEDQLILRASSSLGSLRWMPNHRSSRFASTKLAMLRPLVDDGGETRSTEFRFMVDDPLIRCLLEVRVENRAILTAEFDIW